MLNYISKRCSIYIYGLNSVKKGVSALKKFAKNILPMLICYGAIFVLVLYSSWVSGGVKLGVETCVNLVIPSLFIFMVLGNIIVSSRLCEAIAMPFSPIGRWLFGLDATLMSIVIISLVGGYPIGARMLAKKVCSGEISSEDASHMLCYCVNCGPAFLISGVGAGILGNAKVGVIICISQVLACFTIAILKRGKIGHIKTSKSNYQTGSALLVNAVSDSVKAMATVCGLILCFSVLTAILGQFLGNATAYINGILEVTTAIKPLSLLTNGAVLIAIFTAFGGVCVHMQIAAMLKGCNVSLKRFFLWRIVYASISGGAVFVWLTLFPEPLNCFGISQQLTPLQQASPTATIFLILLSIMLLFFSKKFDRI